MCLDSSKNQDADIADMSVEDTIKALREAFNFV